VWKQQLLQGLSLTFNATNLTENRFELTGGFEQRYQRGRGLGVGISYTVF
jgi:hypothetical protein